MTTPAKCSCDKPLILSGDGTHRCSACFLYADQCTCGHMPRILQILAGVAA